mgnify:CR=1 FL=1
MMNVLRGMGKNLLRSPGRSVVVSREESGRLLCSGIFKRECSNEPPGYCFRPEGNPTLNGWDGIEPLYPSISNMFKDETSSTIVDNMAEVPKDSSDTGE